MTNRERAEEISREILGHYASWPEGCVDRIEQALDEAEKRGQEKELLNQHNNIKRAFIEGQKDVRERAVKEIQERLEDESLQGDRRGNLQSMHLGAMDAIEQILEIISALPVKGE